MELVKCKGPCGELKPPTSFYKKQKFVNDVVYENLDTICKKCRYDARQNPNDVIEKKVRNAISNEAKKLRADSSQLHKWGVTFEWVKFMLLREIELAKLGYHYCQNCYGVKTNGEDVCFSADTLFNFTFDVIDPERMYRTGKLTRSNCRWLCDTSNKAKGSKDPTEYDIEVIETYLEQEAFRKGFQPVMVKEEPVLNQPMRLFP